MDVKNLNVGKLAYIGDSVYEVMIRKYLILNNNVKVNELQKKAIEFVEFIIS